MDDKVTIINTLVDHPKTQFTEEDKPWLNELHEEQLDKMLPVEDEDEDEDDEDLEETINRLPEDLKTVLNQHLDTLTASKTATIDRILACTTNKFTKEQLDAMEPSQLEAIGALIPQAPASPASPEPTKNSGEPEVPLAPISINTYLGASGGDGTPKDKGEAVLGINNVADFSK